MALTAKELLKTAVDRGLLSMDQARAVVGKMREGRKFGELLRDVGGLTAEQIRSLSAPEDRRPIGDEAQQTGGSPPQVSVGVDLKPQNRRTGKRRPPSPAPKKANRAKLLLLSLGMVVLLGVGVGSAVVMTRQNDKPKPDGDPTAANGDAPSNGTTPGFTDYHRSLIDQARDEALVSLQTEDLAGALAQWDRLAERHGAEGEFLSAIEKERAALRADFEGRWNALAESARASVERRQFDAAHLTIMHALKWNDPGYRDRAFAAYADMVEIENAWLAGAPKGLDALRAERNAEVEQLRSEDEQRTNFRRAVEAGDLDGARSVPFPSEALRAQAGAILELAEAANAELVAALQAEVGKRITLDFENESGFFVRTGKLVSVTADSVTIETDEGTMTEKLADMDRGRRGQYATSDAGRAFFLLLAGDYDKAQVPLAKLGKLDAIGLFRDSTSAVAADFATWWGKARSLAGESNRDYDGAHRILTLLLAAESIPEKRRLEMMELRASCAVHQGDFGGAMLDVSAMLDAGDVTDTALAILDHVLNRQGLLDEALAVVERTVKAHPDEPKLYGPLLRLYHMLGRRDEMAAAHRDAPAKAKEEGLFVTLGRWMEAQAGCFSGTLVEKTIGNYRVQTDGGDALADRVGAFMNERYAEYSRLFPFPKNDEIKFLVKVFAKRADFDAYQRKLSPDLVGEHDRLGGFYDPIAQELVMPNEADLEETLRHEGFHQFLDFFTGGAPKWFNEGTASYFETSTVDARKMNPERMASAKRGNGGDGAKSLTELLTMDGATWRSFKGQHILYGQSWSLIYFVVKEGRRDVLDRYFKILMRGEGATRAYHVCFGDLLKVGEWNRAWRRWVEEHDGAADD